MTFLGVDYSTKKISVALVEEDGTIDAESFGLGRNRTDHDENLCSILGQFRSWASDWGALQGAAIEAPIVGMSGAGRTAVRMGMVAGAVFAETTLLTDHICIPAPMQWRKAVCGRGNLDKDGVVAWLRSEHPQAKVVNDDEADAVCLALYARLTFSVHDL